MIFGPKFRYFFQLNEMRDEAKTSGADPRMGRIGTGPPFWQINHANSAYFRLFLGYFRVISATRPPPFYISWIRPWTLWLFSGPDVASSYFFKRKSVSHLNHVPSFWYRCYRQWLLIWSFWAVTKSIGVIFALKFFRFKLHFDYNRPISVFSKNIIQNDFAE